MDKTYYDQTKKLMAEFREKMEQEGKDMFSTAVRELFEEYPKLISFTWTQYTPYFNDGEECIFSAHTDYFHMAIEGDDEENEAVAEDREELHGEDEETERAKIWNEVSDLLKQFDDEDYKLVFGDHCEVTVHRSEGEEIEIDVEEYSHD